MLVEKPAGNRLIQDKRITQEPGLRFLLRFQIQVGVEAADGRCGDTRGHKGAPRVAARLGKHGGIRCSTAGHALGQDVIGVHRISGTLLAGMHGRVFLRGGCALRRRLLLLGGHLWRGLLRERFHVDGFVTFAWQSAHDQLFLSASMEGASTRWISRPLTMERKLFQPAMMTCRTWTPKKPRKAIVVQK